MTTRETQIRRSRTYENLKELNDFLKKNPTHEEILKFVTKYPWAYWGSGKRERFAQECIDVIKEE